MKICKKCGDEKPICDFGRYKKPDGRYSLRGDCQLCISQNCRKWREEDKKNNPDKAYLQSRNNKLQHKYGISLAEFEKMAEAIDYKCEICGEEERTRKDLVVDHNHSTGETRGLLCSMCNTGIGQLGDSPSNLARAIQYLHDRGYYGS